MTRIIQVVVTVLDGTILWTTMVTVDAVAAQTATRTTLTVIVNARTSIAQGMLKSLVVTPTLVAVVLAPDQLSGEVGIVARVILSMTRLLIRATPARLVAIGAQAATVVRSQTAPRCVRHPTVAITVLRRQALFGGMDVDANVDIDGTEQRALLVLGLTLEVIVIDADLVSTNRPIPTVIAAALWLTATTMPTTM